MFITRQKINSTKIAIAVGILVLCLPFAFVHANVVADAVYKLVVSVFGLWLGVGGVVLDYAINEYLVGFGSAYNSVFGSIVDSMWVVIRDLFNLTFIFGLVYIGFRMILDSDNHQTRTWLVHLVLAALLVNFSLFITKFIVDVSNILAVSIITTAATPPNNVITIDPSGNVQMTGSVMQILKITGAFDGSSIQGYIKSFGAAAVPNGPEPWSYIFGTMIVFLVFGFVFIAAGFLLIFRAGALLVLMVFSPVLFLGWVLPGLKGMTSTYWKNFIGRAFFAPLYMLLMYVSLKLIEGVANGKNLNVVAATNGDGANISTAAETFGSFAMAVFFMMASLIAAQKLSVDIGGGAMNAARFARRKAVQGSAYAMGAGLRNTAGRGAQMVANSRRFQALAADNVLARQAHKATRAVADQSFDYTRVPGVAKAAGIKQGKSAGGFSSRQTARAKADEEYFKNIADADMTDEKNIKKAENRAEELRTEGQAEATSAEMIRNELLQDSTKASTDLKTEMDDLQKAIEAQTKSLQTNRKNLSKEDYQAQKRMLDHNKRRLAQKKNTRKMVKDRENAEKMEMRAASAIGPDKQRLMEAARQARAKFSDSVQTSRINYDQQIRAGNNKSNNARIIADGEIKYANKLKYLKRKEEDVARGSLFGDQKKFSGASRQASIDNLKKKFGGDAQSMSKNAADKKRIEEEERARKELADRLGVSVGAPSGGSGGGSGGSGGGAPSGGSGGGTTT